MKKCVVLFALLLCSCEAVGCVWTTTRPMQPVVELPYCVEQDYFVDYVATSPEECKWMLFVCDEKKGEVPFWDNCGCGCYVESSVIE